MISDRRYIYLLTTIFIFTHLPALEVPETKDDFNPEVMVLIEDHRFPEAEEELEEILSEFPDDYRSLNTLAFLRAKETKYERAVELWSEVKELNPDILSVYLYPGIAYIKMGEVESAVLVLNEGLLKFPTNPNLHYNLGVAYHYMDEVALAEDEYWTAHKLDPQHPQTVYNLALIYQSRDDDEKAKELWQKYLDIASDTPSERRYVERAIEFLNDIIYEDIEDDIKE